jgi:peptide deformylase
MAILSIRKYPEPILRKKAKEITKIRKKTLTLIANMLETMYSAKGLGLAATQVGVLQRIIVVDTTPADEKNKPDKANHKSIVLINPKILSQEGENISEEGCLSFPNIIGKVNRAAQIIVSGMNVAGERIEMKAGGLPARIIQHEIDHLDGILFIDRMDKETRKSIKNQLETLKKRKSSK